MMQTSIRKILTHLSSKDNYLFLETRKRSVSDFRSYLFTGPKKIICCDKIDKIKTCLDDIQMWVDKGYFAAGFISYEAASAFEETLHRKYMDGFPLLWFGIYRAPIIYDHRRVRFTDDSPGSDYTLSDIDLNISRQEYMGAISEIKSYIESGHTYQVNYTYKLNFGFSGSVSDLYLALRRNQSVSYSALIGFGNRRIISLSPELFFRKKGRSIQVKPMKGTAMRGRYLSEDRAREKELNSCLKNRSENIMIVDLLRNDLGRISEIGTVNTKNLFDVESYESLLQMTSTVEGKLDKEISLYELLKAIFPSGSVTGAPKISTMDIIGKLEKEPRHIYTGGIGFISPRKEAVFNVAIRTLVLDTAKNRGEMGVGSGIVYDSDPGKEYDECRLKAEFLEAENKDFQLIETMLWQNDKGFPLLGLHLQRLAESAEYFKFEYKEKHICAKLKTESRDFRADKDYRVRLLLYRTGDARITHSLLGPDIYDKYIAISGVRTSSSDPYLFHKTTKRRIYDEAFKQCRECGLYDMIFCNEKGQVTEGAISNIFIKKGSIYYTPPLECGVLNGVYRRYMIRNDILRVKEKILYADDIISSQEIILTNAVRGMAKVRFIDNKERSYVSAR